MNTIRVSVYPLKYFFQHFFNFIETLVGVLLNGGIEPFDFFKVSCLN
ncbi:uncharacterized protein METZ01_LOCUS197118 [marine metagenome]|uniref:Uncharacterized protein n=1 Tax=marine metagenome TaxID=408172 RepID=A0A382E2B3_9ZZZZ